jgi:hypothetical protein
MLQNVTVYLLEKELCCAGPIRNRKCMKFITKTKKLNTKSNSFQRAEATI